MLGPTRTRSTELERIAEFVDEPTNRLLEVGEELRDGGAIYRVMKVEHPANPHSFGHAWVELLTGG
jgi:hypothetical protein